MRGTAEAIRAQYQARRSVVKTLQAIAKPFADGEQNIGPSQEAFMCVGKEWGRWCCRRGRLWVD